MGTIFRHMSKTLLREYVKLVTEVYKGNFNFEHFKSLRDCYEMVNYADKFLTMVDEGSSRRAYILSSRYALKVALDHRGIAQNETELAVYTNPKTQPCLTKMHACDDKYRWIIVDLVKPIKLRGEFKALTGMSWEAFCGAIRKVMYDIDDLEQERLRQERGIKSVDVNDPFFMAVIATMKANDLLVDDISQIQQWGKTSDGRCVILDYGCTNDVYSAFYTGAMTDT